MNAREGIKTIRLDALTGWEVDKLKTMNAREGIKTHFPLHPSTDESVC